MKTNLISMLRMLMMCTALLAFTTACDDDDDDLPIIDDDLEFDNVELSGANEVPEVETTGMGTFEGEYDDATNVLSYTVTWELGNPADQVTAMHFHGPAELDESADPVIPITGFPTTSTGTYSASTRALTEDEEDDLKAGLWYINIHSTTNPGGELRGQLLED